MYSKTRKRLGGGQSGEHKVNPRGSKSFGRAGIPCNMEREGEKWEMMGGGGG